MEKEKTIYVFADFLTFHNELIGKIFVSQTRGKEFLRMIKIFLAFLQIPAQIGEQRIHFSSAMTMLGKKDGANGNWRAIAGKYGINRGEIERMSLAFRECEK